MYACIEHIWKCVYSFNDAYVSVFFSIALYFDNAYGLLRFEKMMMSLIGTCDDLDAAWESGWKSNWIYLNISLKESDYREFKVKWWQNFWEFKMKWLM